MEFKNPCVSPKQSRSAIPPTAAAWDLIATDAAGSAAKQAAEVDSMIAQGTDVLFLHACEEKPLIPAVKKAEAANIPTFLVDRSSDPAAAVAGTDFVTCVGSDFIDQDRRVAERTIENFGDDRGGVVQLESTIGSSRANDHKKGFDDALAADPGSRFSPARPAIARATWAVRSQRRCRRRIRT